MRKLDWIMLAVAVLALGALGTLRGGAADKDDKKVDSEKIAELVKKLGSDNFEDRENASKQLDAIGAPALQELKKAAKGDDAEMRKRAEALVEVIEKRVEIARILAPTKVQLKFKDTPVKEAIADLAKKSGYDIVLQDPANKIGERTVTLETADITFWEALDKLCKEAKLVETHPQNVGVRTGPMRPVGPIRVGPGGIAPPPVPFAPVPLNPAPIVNPPATKPLEKKDSGVPKTVAPVPPAGKGLSGEEIGLVGKQQPPAPTPAPAPPGPKPAPPGVGGRPAFRAMAVTMGGVSAGTIILTDGKPEDVPTCYAGAVRIRALAADPKVIPSNDDEQVFILEVSVEPKLRWLGIPTVRIEKAMDEDGQVRTQNARADGEPGVRPVPLAPPGFARPHIRIRGWGFATTQQQIIVRLKKGEKEATLLKEVKGIISGQVRSPAETLITVDNILKASGTTVKGKKGGALKVIEASKDDDGIVKIRAELDCPPEITPAGQGDGIRAFSGGGGAIRAIPVPAPPPPAAPAPGGAAPAAPARLIPARGVARAQPTTEGLSVLDKKGNVMTPFSTNLMYRANGVGAAQREITLQFKIDKDSAMPAKLVFAGTRSGDVDIPFTLEKVPLHK